MTIDRRQTLSLFTLPAFAAVPALAQVPTDRITVLYRPESDQAPSRLDPAVQAATLALEEEFIKRRFKVLQPTPEVYKLMDQGQGVIVTFADDAGFSLVFSAYRGMRAAPGQEAGTAEVRLQARVFVGRHILVADEGRGQMFTRLEAGVREYGERRALELAARKAAAELADKAERRLRGLKPEELAQLVGTLPSAQMQSVGIGLPSNANPAPAPVAAPAVAASPPPPVAAPALAAATQAPQALEPPKTRHALVIGLSSYEAVRRQGVGIGDLPGVRRDTNLVVDTLRAMGYAGERLRVLRDEQATSAALRGELKRLRAQLGPDDQLALFISGHGADKQYSASGFGMPVLADFKPNDDGALDFWELQSLVKNLACRVVWINDTCHSGGATQSINSVVLSSRGVGFAGNVRGPDAAAVGRNAAQGQDFAIITASAPHEVSWETAGDGGVFTSTLFKALRSTRGEVPLATLFAQTVQREVVDKSKRICQENRQCQQQTPLFAYGGRGQSLRL